jgi:hypothetical protein
MLVLTGKMVSEKNVKKCFFPHGFSDKQLQFWKISSLRGVRGQQNLLFATVKSQERTFFS